MKNNVTDGLNEVLNVESELVEVDNFPEPVKKELSPDAENDYKYARENLYQVIEAGGSAANALVDSSSVMSKSLYMFHSPEKYLDTVQGFLGLDLINKVFAFCLKPLTQALAVDID